jgi:hypothetical protein
MGDNDHASRTADPFTQFWSDMMSRMAPPKAPEAPADASRDAARHMQRIFFDAMAQYFDDFMRSEQFLRMMKESMDRSLQLKQMVNQFLAQAHRQAQSASTTDVDDLAGCLKSIEDRILARIDRLEDKVAAVEASGPSSGRSGQGREARPAARTKVDRQRGR